MALAREGVEVEIAAAADDLFGRTRDWSTALESGLFDALVPEAQGGPGLSLVEACAVAEAAGRHNFPGPVVETLVRDGDAERSRVVAAAMLLGLAERMLGMAVEHARNREQFGRPIAGFQAVQHRLAEMAVAVESMRSLCYLAQIGGAPAAAAKAHASAAIREVAEGALQVHGGIGFTAEHALSSYFLRSLELRSAHGDEHALRRELGLSLLELEAVAS
ncbi:MAG TPA: acyl-CoA dehydrogenase family protein [Candidatus Dormibacteraeota bacterium]